MHVKSRKETTLLRPTWPAHHATVSWATKPRLCNGSHCVGMCDVLNWAVREVMKVRWLGSLWSWISVIGLAAPLCLRMFSVFLWLLVMPLSWGSPSGCSSGLSPQYWAAGGICSEPHPNSLLTWGPHLWLRWPSTWDAQTSSNNLTNAFEHFLGQSLGPGLRRQ